MILLFDSLVLVPNNPSFFSVLFHDHSRITGLHEKGEGIHLTPHCHFYPFHRHLDISEAVTAESSPMHIGSKWLITKSVFFDLLPP